MEDCASDPDFVATAFVSTLNTTLRHVYNGTMNGSSADSFVYEHPYVSALKLLGSVGCCPFFS